MLQFKVNKMLWDAVPVKDRLHITAHLQEHGVLKAGQEIVADAETRLPALCPSMGNITDRKLEHVEALGVDWLCKAICHSTEASFMCSLSDKTLSQCLTKVTASRVNFYRQLDTQSCEI